MSKTELFRWIGITAIISSGLIHLFNAPDELQEARYMGILFFAFFIGSIISAIGIYRHEPLWGWLLGVLLSVATIIGYVLSRTVGLPLMEIEKWGPAMSYLSILLEFIFFVSFLVARADYVRRPQ